MQEASLIRLHAIKFILYDIVETAQMIQRLNQLFLGAGHWGGFDKKKALGVCVWWNFSVSSLWWWLHFHIYLPKLREL